MTDSLPNLRHLLAFREVARRGSASAAARAIHLSQPAISQAIASLEAVFAARLFDRVSRGMLQTEAGRVCSARVERALEQLRNGLAEAVRSRPHGSRAAAGDPLRAITTAQLRSLVAVVEQGGFGRAARALQLSRPTLHRAARQLERAVGVALFEQTSFGIQPTREAARLARGAQLAVAEIAQAHAELSMLAGGGAGSTVIGAMPLARSLLVPSAVLEFSSQFPQHAVSILDGTYDSLLAALRTAAADFLIGAMRQSLPDPDVVQEHLFDDPLAIIVRAGHPLAGKASLTAGDLARYPWIAPRTGSPLRQQFNALFASARLPAPDRSIECNSLIAARAVLLESDHVMLLSAHQVHYELEAGLLAALPHPQGRVVRPIGLTMRRDWRPTSAQRRLLELVRSLAGRLPEHWPVARPSSARLRRGL